jgi:acetylcholinesterase
VSAEVLESLLSLTATTSTTQEVRDWIREFIIPGATQSDLDRLLKLYPANITEGSPFDTGSSNALTPQFKRIAAFQGDAFFQAPRRFFLQHRSGKQTTYSYRKYLRTCVRTPGTLTGVFLVNKRLKTLPDLGSVRLYVRVRHASLITCTGSWVRPL